MYAVEAFIPDLSDRLGIAHDEWQEVRAIPQGDSDKDELAHAERIADSARRFYRNVRITKSVNDTVRVVVA